MMEYVFDNLFEVPEDGSVILTYSDGSERAFDEYEWPVYRKEIKRHLYDKGRVQNIKLSWTTVI